MSDEILTNADILDILNGKRLEYIHLIALPLDHLLETKVRFELLVKRVEEFLQLEKDLITAQRHGYSKQTVVTYIAKDELKKLTLAADEQENKDKIDDAKSDIKIPEPETIMDMLDTIPEESVIEPFVEPEDKSIADKVKNFVADVAEEIVGTQEEPDEDKSHGLYVASVEKKKKEEIDLSNYQPTFGEED